MARLITGEGRQCLRETLPEVARQGLRARWAKAESSRDSALSSKGGVFTRLRLRLSAPRETVGRSLRKGGVSADKSKMAREDKDTAGSNNKGGTQQKWTDV